MPNYPTKRGLEKNILQIFTKFKLTLKKRLNIKFVLVIIVDT